MPVEISNLHIDDEFDKLLRQHSEAENSEFQASVERDGMFFDPILYWTGGGKPVIVDGHRRFRLWQRCRESGKVQPPTLMEVQFADRDAVVRWMIRHQLGRRNLTKVEFDLLLGRLYKQEKRNGDYDASQKLADEFKVSQSTVRRGEKLVDALDDIETASPEAAHKIRTGEAKLTRPEIAHAATLPKEELESVVKESVDRKARKTRPGAEISVGKLVDEIKAGFAGVARRNIEKIADINGGKGIVYERALEHLNEFHKLLTDMRKGIQ